MTVPAGWNPMSTFPKDKEITVVLFGKVCWSDGQKFKDPPEPRVAEWSPKWESFWLPTSNPYDDEIPEPLGWLPLPAWEVTV